MRGAAGPGTRRTGLMGVDANSAPSSLPLVWVMSPTVATPQWRALTPLKVVTTRSGWVDVHAEDPWDPPLQGRPARVAVGLWAAAVHGLPSRSCITEIWGPAYIQGSSLD